MAPVALMMPLTAARAASFALQVEVDVTLGESGGSPEIAESLEQCRQFAEMAGQAVGKDGRVRTPELDLDAPGAHQVVEHAPPVGLVGDAAHGVRDVPVEPGEEAEAVLARKVAPAVAAGAGHAAGLASRDRVALEDGDLKAPLGELVGGAESGHTPPTTTT